MGQSNVRLLKASNITSTTEILLSSWDIKSNLSLKDSIFLSDWNTGNRFPSYFDQNIYQKGIKNLMLRLDGGDKRLYLRDKPDYTLDFRFKSGSDLCIPYILNSKNNTLSNNSYIVNTDGQLFLNTNLQIYHIGRKSTETEITNFKKFYKEVFNVTIDIPSGYDLSDLAGWRITTSKDKPTYFVVRGDRITDVLPRNPLLYPPNSEDITKRKYTDTTNWPYTKISHSDKTKVTPKTEGLSTGCGSQIGFCVDDRITKNNTTDDKASCIGGIPNNPPNGYKITSGFWAPSNFINKPLDMPNQTGIFIADEPEFAKKASAWTRNWSESSNRKTIQTPTCDNPFKTLGSFVKDKDTSIQNLEDKFRCVNNKFVEDDKNFTYPTDQNKLLWHDRTCGSQDDGACFWNTNDTDLSMYCVGPNGYDCIQYTAEGRCAKTGYNAPEKYGLKPYKILTYDRLKNICTGKGGEVPITDVDISRQYKPGIGNCNDLMLDLCSREPDSNECLSYLIANIKSDSGEELDNWVQNFCDKLTTEEKTSGKYAKLCGCHLTNEEYLKIKDKMLNNLAQGDESKKQYFLPLLEGLPKCWYPECNSATSVPNKNSLGPGKECRNLNFNNCISQCNIDNQGRIGDLSCTQTQQCKIVVEGSGSGPSPTPTPSPSPSKTFLEENKILIISSVVVIVILLIIVGIIVIRSK